MKYVIMRTSRGIPEFLSVPQHYGFGQEDTWWSIPFDQFDFRLNTFVTKYLKISAGLKAANLRKSDSSIQIITWSNFLEIAQVYRLMAE